MNPKSKIFLALAGGTGLVMVLGSKKKANAAAASDADDSGVELPPVGPAVPTLDELIPPQPGGPPSFVPPEIRLPHDYVPPPKPIPEDPESEESENPPHLQVPIPGGGSIDVPIPSLPGQIPGPPPQGAAPAPAPKLPSPPPVVIPSPGVFDDEEEEEEEEDEDQRQQPVTRLKEDTADMLRVLLARETAADWKRAEPILAGWQKSRGLTADKKFGPMSAMTLAQETGLLPIVRFWPKGAQLPGAVDDFREDLYELAATAEEPRRSQLKAAAEREQGQGFGRNPLAISPTISI